LVLAFNVGARLGSGVIEWVRDRMVRVQSEFLGGVIESADAIAPGDWVISR
jgi:hypothetical protein